MRILGRPNDHHYLFPYVCDGIDAMKQGLQAWQIDELHGPPVVALMHIEGI